MSKELHGKSSEKRETKRKIDWKALEVVHPHAAGIDIGGSEHWVAINPERDEQPVRCFACYTEDLEQMADRLLERGGRGVAVPSTGGCWLSEWEVLQAG